MSEHCDMQFENFEIFFKILNIFEKFFKVSKQSQSGQKQIATLTTEAKMWYL